VKYEKQIIAILLAIICVQGFLLISPYLHKPNEPSNVFIVVHYPNGEIVREESHNLITLIGAEYVHEILAYDNRTDQDILKYIAISNETTTPTTSWTKLPNENTDTGYSRGAGTVVKLNSTAWNVTYTWVNVSYDCDFNCTGLHWSGTAGSDNNLFAVATFNTLTVTTGSNFTVTWIVNVVAG